MHLAFYQWTSRGSRKMVLQQYWRKLQRWWALVGPFAFNLQSIWSQTILVGFRSGDCGGQVIWRITLSRSNSHYTARRWLLSLSCWKINDLTKRKLAGMACRCKMLWWPCWFSVPSILNKWSKSFIAAIWPDKLDSHSLLTTFDGKTVLE